MNARPFFALAAAALTTGLLVGTTVNAAAFETRSIDVSYADLDVATPAGRAALERRIELAADRICTVRRALDLKSLRAADKCRLAAIADATAKVELAVATAQASRQYASAQASAGGR
jgi:UrcA family protein